MNTETERQVQTLGPDSRLGAYRIVRLLGKGGMATVYEAVHEQLGTRVALKVFATEDASNIAFKRKRFLAEGKVLARLHHPRIVHVYDLAVDPGTGTPYFAMDLVLSPSGRPQTLEDARQAGVDENRVAGWLADLCEGLAYIHGEGIVHRDVKLENVLVGPDGRAVISDFGISRIFDKGLREQIDLTMVTIVDDAATPFRLGTGHYMAPELRRPVPASATPASDAWALGVLVFRLLTGIWYERGTKVLDMLAGYDLPWPAVMERLCAERPSDRLPEGGIAAVPMMLSRRPGAARRTLGAKLVAVAAVLAAVAVLAAIYVASIAKSAPAVSAEPGAGISREKGVDDEDDDDQDTEFIIMKQGARGN